jgi:hypothetical protein
MTEYEARTLLFHAANYIHSNQLGVSARTKAMDMLDDIRRDWANWHDLSAHYGVAYRDHVVFSHHRAVQA